MTRSLRNLGLAVKRLQVQHHRAANEALDDLGLTIVQWDALRHLHENPGASLHELAVLTFQTDQSFGALAARMEAAGLIERVAGPGRAIRPALTAKGEELREQGGRRLDRVLERSFGPLSDAETEQLEGLLTRLLA